MIKITSRVLLVPGLLALVVWTGNALAVPCQNNLPASNPDFVYTDHGNGTVTDTRTGLMWKQCAEGLSGATCQTGYPQTFTWANALAHAEASTFASYTDWRLPNVKELFSLVEYCRGLPSINTSLFPNTPFSDFWSGLAYFWSASPELYHNTGAWGVSFYIGGVYDNVRDSDSPIRLVRDGQ